MYGRHMVGKTLIIWVSSQNHGPKEGQGGRIIQHNTEGEGVTQHTNQSL